MNSHRVSRWLITLAPTLTSATLVPKSLPEAQTRTLCTESARAAAGICLEDPHAGHDDHVMAADPGRRPERIDALASALSAIASRQMPLLYFWYQCQGTASMPYRSFTCSGPVHMASRMASGWSALRYPSTASTEASLPILPEPSPPNRPTRGAADDPPSAWGIHVRHESFLSRPGHDRVDRDGTACQQQLLRV